MAGAQYSPENRYSLYQEFFGPAAEDVIIRFNEDSSLFEWVIPDSIDKSELPQVVVGSKFTAPDIAFEAMESFLVNALASKRKEAADKAKATRTKAAKDAEKQGD